MKWEGNRQSENVEDRRGGRGIGLGGGSVGLGTIAIALVASWFFGVSPMTVLSLLTGGGGAPVTQGPAQAPPASDQMAKFVSTVLADTEDTWTQIFREQGGTYAKPRLVLFAGSTPTACGTGQSAMGPFYCPGDQKIYIDLSFYQTMQQRFKVSGEFAQAYVIAHEVGHHVQHLMGISGKVDSARRRLPEAQANALSVRLELQADCFAGVWAKNADQARGILEAGDVEAALNAASAIGDDALQRRSQGHVVPDSFTHGTSAQRVRWFKRGLEGGTVTACNTFETQQLWTGYNARTSFYATPTMHADALHTLRSSLDDLKHARIDTHAFCRIWRAQSPFLAALPARYREVMEDLLGRMEAGSLFTEESCSFSQDDLQASLAVWLDKAGQTLGAK